MEIFYLTKISLNTICLEFTKKVPLLLVSKTETEIQRILDMDVRKKVVVPTQWCTSMIVVTKANSQVRIYVDFSQLIQIFSQELLQKIQNS